MTFLTDSSSLLEAQRQPLLARFNERRHPRTAPAVDQVSISGPYVAKGVADTPSRRRIFVCRPESADTGKELDCAKTILSTLMRRAYRAVRSTEGVDSRRAAGVLSRRDAPAGDFEAGIGRALSAVLMNPEFLFRVEADPKKAPAGERLPHQRSRARLAPLVLSVEQHPRRRAARCGNPRQAQPAGGAREADAQDARRPALGQPRDEFRRAVAAAAQSRRGRAEHAIFPEFDDNMREGFRQETELFIDSIVREDRSVLDLIKADYTFLNERLAKYYGIPNVYGSHFRRVTVSPESRRGGPVAARQRPRLSRRTRRGRRRLFAACTCSTIFSARRRRRRCRTCRLSMKARYQPISRCASGLRRIARTPYARVAIGRSIRSGFALENFNAVGQWRSYEGEGEPIDASGALAWQSVNSAASTDSKTRCSASPRCSPAR